MDRNWQQLIRSPHIWILEQFEFQEECIRYAREFGEELTLVLSWKVIVQVKIQ